MQHHVEPLSPAVLVASDDASLVERCRAALEASARLALPSRPLPPGVAIDVIVITGPFPTALLNDELPSVAIRPGVIALGQSVAEADLVLPLDFLPRELVNSCRLLASIVRLRRQLADHQHSATAWQQEAHRDALTGLANRRAWDAELRLRSSLEAARPLCLAVADIDHFKQVNDNRGHAAGDRLLSAVAAALRHSLRQDDFVARLGGDEFGLLFSGIEPSAMAVVLERIQAGLPARIAAASDEVVSVSIGFACWLSSTAANVDALASAADDALRQAKRQGRNRVVAAELPQV
jgi:diguanylate cyclase (GGDEF)-like protein